MDIGSLVTVFKEKGIQGVIVIVCIFIIGYIVWELIKHELEKRKVLHAKKVEVIEKLHELMIDYGHNFSEATTSTPENFNKLNSEFYDYYAKNKIYLPNELCKKIDEWRGILYSVLVLMKANWPNCDGLSDKLDKSFAIEEEIKNEFKKIMGITAK